MQKLHLLKCLIFGFHLFTYDNFNLYANKLKRTIMLSAMTTEKPVSMNAFKQRLKFYDTEKTIQPARINIHKNWYNYDLAPKCDFINQSILSLDLPKDYQSRITIEYKSYKNGYNPSYLFYKSKLLFIYYDIIHPKDVTDEEQELKIYLEFQTYNHHAYLLNQFTQGLFQS